MYTGANSVTYKSSVSFVITAAHEIGLTQLFVGCLPCTTTMGQIHAVFGPFGNILGIHTLQHNDGTGQYAAFVRFEQPHSATMAIAYLDQLCWMQGSYRPIQVCYAHTPKQKMQRRLGTQYKQDQGSVNLAHPNASHHPTATEQPSKKLGGDTKQEASTSYRGDPISGQSHGSNSPTQVAFYEDPSSPPHGSSIPARPPDQTVTSKRLAENHNQRRRGPAGSNLFIFHLPVTMTDEDLNTAFKSFGTIVSANVYVNKYTGRSKGFGALAYAMSVFP